ncbi:MAG: glycosyltransferase family 39 protein [Bacteroidales bacterium]|nr:glycosyltransferase family 39 protein [Bacteroidales bacterium]
MKNYRNCIYWFESFLRKYWILVLFMAVKLILQFVFVNPIYELHRDEFLYLDQAFHPAAGYISVPPFTSWIAKIIYLLGGGIFWIRFFPAFFGALTLVFIWFMVEELGGRFYARLLASVTYIFSVFARMHVLFQPNAFDILIWTVLFFLLIKYVKTQHFRWLVFFSVFAALGLYNKYTIVFLIAGLILGLVVSNQRRILSKKDFYISIAFCVVLLVPNIIWQINNHFPVIYHMKALSKGQLANIDRMDFLFDQVKYGLVGLVFTGAFAGLIFFTPFKPYRFIGYSFLVIIFLFILSRAKSYYAFGLYPVVFVLGSVYLEAVFKKRNKIFVPAIALLSIVIFLMSVRFMMPALPPSDIKAQPDIFDKMGLLRWEDGKNHSLPQDFADMTGWKEMADKSLKTFQMIPENESANILVLCDNYGQAGALNYYNRGRMPEAYSFNTDYIYWLPEMKRIENVIIVGKQPKQEILNMFSSCVQTGIVENEFSRERGTGVYLLMGAKPVFTETLYNKADERKRKFNIF